MKSSKRMPGVRCGCFGDVEENRDECSLIPREDEKSPEEFDVSSFADPEEDAGVRDLGPSRAERSPGGAQRFDAFVSAVAARLRAGEREYGNRSFARPPTELVGEIAEELEDVAGWAFILWCRLRDLRVALSERGRSE
jgi:hypothetical protein